MRMDELKWENLLCKKRQRMSKAEILKPEQKSAEKDTNIARNEFEADYDRIVGSSSVRRLQDKAQVFPLQENDFTRTRLTHSMEVSALARSLGKAVGRKIEKLDKDFTSDMTEELAALLQTAGLIHDLGNPPFGHYGETVIHEWFSEWFASEEFQAEKEKLTLQEKNDFIYFDGNVQNLRIVTKLQTLNDGYGANFTYATLATIIKYPWDSTEANDDKKKFGFFKSEEELVKDIRKETGLKEKQRHPATYLLEAADDIIYLCDDIEDGVKKGYIDWKQDYDDLKEKYSIRSKEYCELFKLIDSKVIRGEMDKEEEKMAAVRNFRNHVQSFLFSKVIDEFMDHYSQIMTGKYEKKELLQCQEKFVKALKKITAENCFSCHEVLALELVGDKVIRKLLDIFVRTLISSDTDTIEKSATYGGKIYRLISPNFKYIALYDYDSDKAVSDGNETKMKMKSWEKLTIYDKIHLAVDFISGMTDSYAVNLYKELMGINIPS